MLYNNCTADTTPYGWYSALRMGEILIESVVTSFSNVADDMPGQGLFDMEVRPKLIHSVGLVS